MLKFHLLLVLFLSVLVTKGQVCRGNFGDNIFRSGDFGQGANQILQTDPGLAPGYIYTTNLPPQDGFYTIVNQLNRDQIFNDWLSIGDNSGTRTGYMMVVNATIEPGLFYEETITNLCDDVLYEFSADIFNLIASFSTDRIDPNVSFLLNDEVVFSTGSIPKNERWNIYGFTFTTQPGQETLKLSLRNNAPGGIGNDLALDNITFRPCGATALILPTTVANICEDGDPIDIMATVEGAEFEEVFVQWQESLDEGNTWFDLEGQVNETFTFNNLRAGEYYYRFLLADTQEKLSNPNCRTISNVRIVRVIPKFVQVTDSICVGLSTPLGENNLSATGIFVDTLQNILGCDSIVTLDLTIVENDLSASFLITDPSCTDFSDGTIEVLSLTSQGPYSFQVRDQTVDDVGSLQGVPAGSYSYQIFDRFGCQLDTTLMLVDPPEFAVDLGPDLQLLLGERFEVSQFVTGEAATFRWIPSTIDCRPPCESISELFAEDVTVALTATSTTDCIVFDEVSVGILRQFDVFIPNVFTPNGDGVNDFFTVFNRAGNESAKLVSRLNIHDRTGRLVYSRESFSPGIEQLGWDGTNNGSDLASGTYYYSANVLFINSEEVTFNGDLLLLR